MATLINTVALVAALLPAHTPPSSPEDYRPEELEPCINGAVSASGLFPSQDEEDAYARSVVERRRR